MQYLRLIIWLYILSMIFCSRSVGFAVRTRIEMSRVTMIFLGTILIALRHICSRYIMSYSIGWSDIYNAILNTTYIITYEYWWDIINKHQRRLFKHRKLKIECKLHRHVPINTCKPLLLWWRQYNYIKDPFRCIRMSATNITSRWIIQSSTWLAIACESDLGMFHTIRSYVLNPLL